MSRATKSVININNSEETVKQIVFNDGELNTDWPDVKILNLENSTVWRKGLEWSTKYINCNVTGEPRESGKGFPVAVLFEPFPYGIDYYVRNIVNTYVSPSFRYDISLNNLGTLSSIDFLNGTTLVDSKSFHIGLNSVTMSTENVNDYVDSMQFVVEKYPENLKRYQTCGNVLFHESYTQVFDSTWFAIYEKDRKLNGKQMFLSSNSNTDRFFDGKVKLTITYIDLSTQIVSTTETELLKFFEISKDAQNPTVIYDVNDVIELKLYREYYTYTPEFVDQGNVDFYKLHVVVRPSRSYPNPMEIEVGELFYEQVFCPMFYYTDKTGFKNGVDIIQRAFSDCIFLKGTSTYQGTYSIKSDNSFFGTSGPLTNSTSLQTYLNSLYNALGYNTNYMGFTIEAECVYGSLTKDDEPVTESDTFNIVFKSADSTIIKRLPLTNGTTQIHFTYDEHREIVSQANRGVYLELPEGSFHHTATDYLVKFKIIPDVY